MTDQFPIILTGGSRVGKIHSSWPFSKLRIEKSQITLHASSGSYTFSNTDEIKITKHLHLLLRVPIGIEIKHTNPKYPLKVIFWYWRINRLNKFLSSAGFTNKIDLT